MARVQSSDPTRALVAPDAATPGAPYIAVTIADGQIDASFYVQGLEGQSGDVAVTVSAPGFDDGVSGTTTIAPPAYRLIGLPASVSATDPTFVFYAEIGVPTAGNTDLLNQSYSGVAQALRAGAAPLTVTVTNDNPAASQLVSGSGGAQQWAVSILPGQAATSSSVGTGGIAFDRGLQRRRLRHLRRGHHPGPRQDPAGD